MPVAWSTTGIRRWKVSNSTTTTRLLPQRPINRYSILDNEPVRVFVVAGLGPEVLSKELGVERRTAEQLAALAETTSTPVAVLGAIAGLQFTDRERIRRLGI